MAILSMAKISKMFSDTVTEYLNSGYIINAETIGNMYSDEICHVDLVPKKNKDKKLVRIWLLKSTEDINESLHWIQCVNLSVVEFDLSRTRSFWRCEGKKLRPDKTFYKLGQSHKCYADSKEDYLTVYNKRKYRLLLKNKSSNDGSRVLNVENIPITVKDFVMQRIKLIPGAKRAKSFDCIKKVTANTNYSYRKNLVYEVSWEFNNKSGVIIIK